MKNPIQITEIALPVPEFADLSVRAAQQGVSTAHYLGVLALAGAYGFRHPVVVAFDERAKPGINGPVIEEGEA